MSFFDRQPPLFDTKKRLGTTQTVNLHERIIPSTQNYQSDEVESQPGMIDSWVELAPSRASLCSSVEAVMVDRECSNSEVNGTGSTKDFRLSPVSIQSPHVEFESNFDQVKYQLAKDMIPSSNKSVDWIWDWSSRPETVMPNRILRQRTGQISSELTTPPNSPEPDTSCDFEFSRSNGKNKKSIFYRFEVIIGMFITNLFTFMIGATIGYCICKRVTKSNDLL